MSSNIFPSYFVSYWWVWLQLYSKTFQHSLILKRELVSWRLKWKLLNLINFCALTAKNQQVPLNILTYEQYVKGRWKCTFHLKIICLYNVRSLSTKKYFKNYPAMKVKHRERSTIIIIHTFISSYSVTTYFVYISKRSCFIFINIHSPFPYSEAEVLHILKERLVNY